MSTTRQFWTRTQHAILLTMIEDGHSYATIARRLKRTYLSVRAYAKREGLQACTNRDVRNARQVAALFGASERIVGGWIADGMLAAHNAGTATRPIWRITSDHLLSFMACRARWMSWTPAGIADLALREWATEIRDGTWHPITHVCARLCVSEGAVMHWIRAKKIPATFWAHQWWIWSGDLDAFVVPSRTMRARPFVTGRIPLRLCALLTDTPQTVATLCAALKARPQTVRGALRDLRTRGLAQSSGGRGAGWVRLDTPRTDVRQSP